MIPYIIYALTAVTTSNGFAPWVRPDGALHRNDGKYTWVHLSENFSQIKSSDLVLSNWTDEFHGVSDITFTNGGVIEVYQEVMAFDWPGIAINVHLVGHNEQGDLNLQLVCMDGEPWATLNKWGTLRFEIPQGFHLNQNCKIKIDAVWSGQTDGTLLIDEVRVIRN